MQSITKGSAKISIDPKHAYQFSITLQFGRKIFGHLECLEDCNSADMTDIPFDYCIV